MSFPARPRWELHPLTFAVALLLTGGFAAITAIGTSRDLAAAAASLLLAAVAGAAAGFANSGSTRSHNSAFLLSTSVRRDAPVIRFFGSGLLLGASVVAFVAAVVGALPQLLVPAPVRWALFGGIAVAVVAREAGMVRFAVPQNARLVAEDVQHLREWGALQFGVEMGSGWRTYSPSALPHLVLVAVVLVVPFPAAFAVAAGFAAGRLAMPLLSNAWSDDGGWRRVWSRSERVVRPLLALTATAALTVAMLTA